MGLLAIVRTNYNGTAWAALAGALAATPGARDLPLRFVQAGPNLPARLATLARQHEPLVVAFSFSSPNVPAVATQVAAIRAALGQTVTLIAGGPHPTGDPAGTLALGFDLVVRGEGEATFPALAQRLLAGQPWDDLSAPLPVHERGAGLPGLAYERQGVLVVAPLAAPVDLDSYPPFSLVHRCFGAIEISRGCPHACGFCQVPRMFGGRMRHRSVETIVRAVSEAQAAGYYHDYARFVTPDAFAYGSPDGRTANPAAIEALLQAMRSRFDVVYFGSFPSQVHPLTVTPQTVALVRRYCANDNLALGAQTGSPRLLRSLGRGHTVDDVRRAVRLTLNAGLRAYVDFIFGLPGEQEEDLAASVALVEELTSWGAIICGHAFMPLPGTRLAGAAPGVVTLEVRRLLGRLAQRGQALETWRTQEGYAAEIAELRLAA